MDSYYLDTSVFLKRYIQEPGSEAIRDLLNRGGRFFTSKVAYVEVLMTFRRKRKEGKLSDEDISKCIEVFEKDWEAFNIIELSDEVLQVLKNFKGYLRALDAIHLSSALWIRKYLNVVFVCSDHNLKKQAKLEGFHVWDPTE
ncbi:MAG: hypothetical protein DRN92_07145 [Thermoproteota archaeon]|nr:MAG: hypothetical protein DRN92_07145 [Candidatus Korarchaeota archaeon]